MTLKVTSNPSLSMTHQKVIHGYSCCGTTTETTELNADERDLSISKSTGQNQNIIAKKMFLKKLFIFFLDDHHQFIIIAAKKMAIPLKRSVMFPMKQI